MKVAVRRLARPCWCATTRACGARARAASQASLRWWLRTVRRIEDALALRHPRAHGVQERLGLFAVELRERVRCELRVVRSHDAAASSIQIMVGTSDVVELGDDVLGIDTAGCVGWRARCTARSSGSGRAATVNGTKPLARALRTCCHTGRSRGSLTSWRSDQQDLLPRWCESGDRPWSSGSSKSGARASPCARCALAAPVPSRGGAFAASIAIGPIERTRERGEVDAVRIRERPRSRTGTQTSPLQSPSA